MCLFAFEELEVLLMANQQERRPCFCTSCSELPWKSGRCHQDPFWRFKGKEKESLIPMFGSALCICHAVDLGYQPTEQFGDFTNQHPSGQLVVMLIPLFWCCSSPKIFQGLPLFRVLCGSSPRHEGPLIHVEMHLSLSLSLSLYIYIYIPM